ncbi:hypothetical protein LOTGIDRAFT_237545 [Lottia gigantea]|uniref:TMEM248/TMEM219 domain-containing protein n=1 Tax=Lottia gigantea TaxID=225164 RepID=V4CNZ1_LOTGI|nr:hypothetical protein LOTGIDRAFT_237545 [Lottia gigantea]ESP04130.1 hypothetical protein LOTGIDRAFT_237545 [Lottia gigantea]
MTFVVIENLKGFSQSRPPIVVFMVCLGAFAVALITFAYIVKVRDMPNPDMTEDWNSFLQSFSDVEFCVLSNSSDFVTESTSSATGTSSLPTKKMSEVLKDIETTTFKPITKENEGVVNISLSMLVEMTPTVDFVSIPHNITYLSTTLSGRQLGLNGHVADQVMNVTFTLPFEWNTTKCTGEDCITIPIYTCISFQAPESFFPKTSQPDRCVSSAEGGIEYRVKMVGHKTRQNVMRCEKRPVIQVRYQLDPSLTVMLSLNDRSLINLHLMHTSYFLFVMVITMFCYALVRGRPSKGKVVHYIEKVPTSSA